jgi:hypothetical protein
MLRNASKFSQIKQRLIAEGIAFHSHSRESLNYN